MCYFTNYETMLYTIALHMHKHDAAEEAGDSKKESYERGWVCGLIDATAMMYDKDEYQIMVEAEDLMKEIYS